METQRMTTKKVRNGARRRKAAERITVDGRMTVYEAAELRTRIVDGLAADRMELDLSGVGELDSAGVQLLLLAKREMEASGKAFSIVRSSAAVQELLRFYNLAGLLGDIVPGADPAPLER